MWKATAEQIAALNKIRTAEEGFDKRKRWKARESIPEDAELFFTSYDIKDLSVNDAKRELSLQMTTVTPDADRDVILPMGLDLSRFMKSPTILYGHDWNALLESGVITIVGKATLYKRTKTGISAVVKVAPTEFAQQVYDLVKYDFLRMCSIGFLPGEWGEVTDEDRKAYPDLDWSKADRVIRTGTLLECSIVPIGCNPDAIAEAVTEKTLPITHRSFFSFEPIGLKFCKDKDEPKICEGCGECEKEPEPEPEVEPEEKSADPESEPEPEPEPAKPDPETDPTEDAGWATVDDGWDEADDNGVVSEDALAEIEAKANEPITKPGWDTPEEGEYIHYQIRDPKDFPSLGTKTIQSDPPVKGRYGVPRGEKTGQFQSLLFPKDRWTEPGAKDWLKEHSDLIKRNMDEPPDKPDLPKRADPIPCAEALPKDEYVGLREYGELLKKAEEQGARDSKPEVLELQRDLLAQWSGIID